MIVKPKFYFTAYKNSFKVLVQNLESLSVEQIQSIERFVNARKGIFDFTTYTFIIQKKLEFEEFVNLIKNSSLSPILINNPLKQLDINRVSFGQYKGMSYSEIPNSYLEWLKGNYHGKDRNFIDLELKKRKL